MTDREIIRELAKRYAEISSLPMQQENALLYRALNSLRPIRPVVLIDEILWSQLAEQDELKELCRNERTRRVERFFRTQLYRWNHFRCDRIFVNYFPRPRHITIGSFGIDVQANILAYDVGNNIVSHAYKDQLLNEKAIERLHAPDISFDSAADARDLEWLNRLIGDILPIRLTGLEYAGFFEPWDNIAEWRGAEPLLWDLAMMTRVEELNPLDASSPFIHSTAGLYDDLTHAADDKSVTRRNIWGRGAAQIFASVSPAMTEEFEIDYAKRFFEGFGLVYYGCCEPLHRKLDIVRQLPNLRKISITPWADVDMAAEQMGGEFVMSNKPNPALLASDNIDESVVRAELNHALAACLCNDTPVEFTLKDISSINNHPDNLDKWANIAMEMVR